MRSGQYAQNRGRLRWHDTYCCLGVLCDISVENPDDHWRVAEVDSFSGAVFWFDESERSLPEAIRIELGIHLDEERYLAARNDTGASFEDISAWIETEL